MDYSECISVSACSEINIIEKIILIWRAFLTDFYRVEIYL